MNFGHVRPDQILFDFPEQQLVASQPLNGGHHLGGKGLFITLLQAEDLQRVKDNNLS